MADTKNNSNELNNFESLQIGLASTEKILSWSHGEVEEPETINYRTLKPEPKGLFCEAIFGPTKDWECHCGKYKKIQYRGLICDKCGVEITKSKVRRERMGHIKLAAPVSHIWYFKGIPSRMGLVLDMTPRNLERVLYFATYIVLEPGDSGFEYKEIISEQQYRDTMEQTDGSFRAGIGAEAIRELLCDIDLDELSADLRDQLKNATGQKKVKIVRRLEVVEALRLSGNRPEWMVLEVIPVIPPDLRPMVQLDGGRFATSDLNDLYRRVINRNKRLKRLLDLGAPDIIVRNEKRMLQEAVDALIDNGRRGRPVTGPGSRPLKSLSDMLKGKQGRFRQNLLGKRVDYSGRSVIVVGPELRFWQCGLPKNMALELFKPFIMKRLVEDGDAHNIKGAKKMVERVDNKVWDVLEDVIKDHPVMLNRAPTLHRLGIQAFEPVLVEGKAIKLHPLACTAFNADFDGDQMAVHVPLSVEAQAEARFLMLSVNNILAPKDGSPITIPTQDMILGSYYLTHPGVKNRDTDAEKGDGKIFCDYNEMVMAYRNHDVGIHARVKVRRYNGENDRIGKCVESTVGRFIFNSQIPQDLGYVPDRDLDPYSLEIDFLVGKKQLGDIIGRCFKRHGNTGTALMLDAIKDMGYHYSTIGAVTISVADMPVPESKNEIIAAAEEEVNKYEDAYKMGLMSNDERYEKVIDIWANTTDKVADELMECLDETNNLFIMADSGARGSKKQIQQIGGMRGLMGNAQGQTVEIPVKANFREGLSILEYFISANGARKGLADTALRTADSGYLTRRLVDVSHNVIVREEDCGTTEGVEVRAFVDGKEIIEPLKQRIVGRTALHDIVHPQTGEIIVRANDEIMEEAADTIDAAGIESVEIRSIMTCMSRSGVCTKCYGRNLATGRPVHIGEAVGITAAQSIGEPGTQLTMRTFHTGGVAGGDITQGLPRVEELFEARKPKGIADICEADGTVVEIEPTSDNKTRVVVEVEGSRKPYIVAYGKQLAVEKGDFVEAGGNITRGPLNPHDIMRLRGVEGVYQYLLKEVQRVYKLQGVDINDKHIEVIVSRMLSKYRIEDPGDTKLLPGGLYTIWEIQDANDALAEGQIPATYKRILLGITKASLATSSFLSAASFQETTRVLTDAAIKGRNDRLQGLKENVIIGKLIPAGTGMKQYKNIEVDYGPNQEYIDEYMSRKREEEEEEAREMAMADREQSGDGIKTLVELDNVMVDDNGVTVKGESIEDPRKQPDILDHPDIIK
ncbi:MAG: DNA-directed RNA polymerase subunit beta' [Anaerovoracaceae bacterium]|jgi:DNA-directed RNA polymerase subunit beta'